MSLSDLYNIRKVLRSEREDKGLGAGLSEDKVLGAQGLADRTCIFCRKETAKYACPSCNAAYCSTTCFKSPRHGSCTKSFARRVVEENKDVLGGVEDSEEDEKRRRGMMEILRKFEDADPDAPEEEELDAEDPGADLQDVHSVEELLSMLSEEEQQTFHAMLRDPDSRERLIEQLMRGADQHDPSGAYHGTISARQQSSLLSEPWWTSPWKNGDDEGAMLRRLQVDPKREQVFASKDASFFSSLQDLIERQRGLPRAPSTKRVDLRFNLLAVILSYVYMCRHLAAESLAAALSSEVPYNTNAARVDAMDVSPESITSATNTAYGLLDRLVPFLTLAPPPANKKTQGSLGESRISAMVLTDAEDASLWLLSRLGPEHAGSQPGALLLALIQDAEKIMLPSSIVTASVDPQSASQLLDDFPGYVDLITSVFDIWLLLEAARVDSAKMHPAQGKLLFYLSQFLASSNEDKGLFERRLKKERVRLEKEQERATLEEDFRARDRFETGQSDIAGTMGPSAPVAVVQEMEEHASTTPPAAAPRQSGERKQAKSFGALREKRAARR